MADLTTSTAVDNFLTKTTKAAMRGAMDAATGPGTSTAGNLTRFANTDGQTLEDSGAVALDGVASSAGAGDSGKVPLLNGSGVLDSTFLASTGTGNVVRATSPALVTPALGVPTAIDLSNATNLPARNVAQGGTGQTTLTNHAVLIGAGTSGITSVAPGTSGNILTSDGTSWTSSAAPSGTLPSQTGNNGKYLTTDGSAASWGTVSGGSGDMLSTLVNSEVSITGATTATISKMHVCSGTSADYPVMLPAVSGNAGKFIGFRMAAGLTKLVTIDGASSETIDGALTRIMWANETAILHCDGTTWTKVAGKTIPMFCTMKRSASLNINNASIAKVNLDATISDTTGLMADPTTNNRINIIRPGIYNVSGGLTYAGISASGDNIQSRVNLTGTLIKNAVVYGPSGSYPAPAFAHVATAVAGDYLELYAFHNTGSSQSLYTTDPVNILLVLEQSSW